MHPVLVAALAFVAMEPFTALAHRFVMHGAGERLHRSHHRRPRPGESPRRWEANDVYPLVFASLVMLAMAVGFNVGGAEVLVPAAIGVTVYGAAYALVHDVYIHRRLGWFGDRTVPVLEQLAVAHRRHHDRSGAPYGMLLPVVAQRGRRGSRPSHEPLDA